MQRNTLLKNQKNQFTGKMSKSKKLGKWPKMVSFFCPGGPNFDPLLTFFFQITSKYALKHHIKKSEKFIG